MMHIGCSGYSVGKGKYYEELDIVELPQTFFHPPGQRVLASWRASAPVGFEFIVRAWQLITHEPASPTYTKLDTPVPDYKILNYGRFRPTPEVWHAWEETVKAATVLRARLIVFQTPPDFRKTRANELNMRVFFEKIRNAGFSYVWDARGWSAHDALVLCNELGLVYAADPFKGQGIVPLSKAGRITYLRLSGKCGHRYNYSGEELRELYLRYGGRGRVYVVFENSRMYENALSLKHIAMRRLNAA